MTLDQASAPLLLPLAILPLTTAPRYTAPYYCPSLYCPLLLPLAILPLATASYYTAPYYCPSLYCPLLLPLAILPLATASYYNPSLLPGQGRLCGVHLQPQGAKASGHRFGRHGALRERRGEEEPGLCAASGTPACTHPPPVHGHPLYLYLYLYLYLCMAHPPHPTHP